MGTSVPPVPAQDSGSPPPNSQQVLQDVETLRKKGLGSLVPRYLERNNISSADFLDIERQAHSGRNVLQKIVRGIGLGDRAIATGLQTAVNTPRNLVAMAGSAMANHFIGPEAGQRVSQFLQAGPPNIADRELVAGTGWHLPTPETPAESTGVNVLQDAASALPFAIGGGPLALASTVASGVAGGMAQRAAADRGYGPTGQAVAGLVAGMATPALMSGGAAMVRRALAGAAAQREAARSAQAVLAAATGTNAVTLGQVTEGGIGRSIERSLRGPTLGTAAPFGKTLATQEQGLQSNAQSLVDQLAPIDQANPEAAGAITKLGIEGPPATGLLTNQSQINDILAMAGKGPATPLIRRIKVSEGYIPKFWEKTRQMYDEAYSRVPADTPVIPTNTQNWFQRQNQASESALIPALNNPAIEEWGNQFASAHDKYPNGMPFEELKKLRSLIDDKIQSFDPAVAATQGTNMKDLIGLRAALSDDIGATVIMQGGREGAQKWQAAQSFFGQGMDNIENIFKPLVVRNTPEKVFQALLTGTKQGATIIRTTMNELEPEQRRIVLSSIFRKWLTGPKGDFDMATLANQWRKLTPDTRVALTQHLGVDATNNLNNLFKAVDIMRMAEKSLPLPAVASGGLFRKIIGGLAVGGPALSTAGVLSSSPAVIGTGIGAAGAAGAAQAGLQGIAHMVFTSPRAVKWLLGTTRLPEGVLPASLIQLSKQARQWPPQDQSVAKAIIRQLQPPDMPDIDTMSTLQAPSDMTAVR